MTSQMGESAPEACCGADAVEPIATLGYGVWKFGQDVQHAQVWKPFRKSVCAYVFAYTYIYICIYIYIYIYIYLYVYTSI